MGGNNGEPVSSLGSSWAEAAASSSSHRNQPVPACWQCALADDYGVRARQSSTILPGRADLPLNAALVPPNKHQQVLCALMTFWHYAALEG